MIKYTKKIEHGEWKNGDIICFPLNMNDEKPHFDVVCEVKDGKLLELPEMKEADIKPYWKCIRIDYKFISDGTWYVKDTEAYPTHMLSSESAMGVFLGWTNEQCKEKDPKPRWDGESCNMDEFKIIKR